jgi:signal transduction protein with GAF and PtsI domain
MSSTDLRDFSIDGEEIEVVDRFTFLVSTIQSDTSCENEIRRRLQLGRVAQKKLHKVVKDRDVS